MILLLLFYESLNRRYYQIYLMLIFSIFNIVYLYLANFKTINPNYHKTYRFYLYLSTPYCLINISSFKEKITIYLFIFLSIIYTIHFFLYLVIDCFIIFLRFC